jgi:DNA mismatch repair protein MutL
MKMQSENRPRHKTVSVLDSVTPNQTKIQANITRLYEKQAAQPVQPAQSVPTRLGVSDVTRKPAPVQPAAAPVSRPAPAAAPVVTVPVVEKKPVPAVTEERKSVIPVTVEIPAPPVARPEPAPAPAPIVEEPEVPAWRMAGEVLNTYIVVEQGDSVFFIDKHAAHERMNFDRMKAQNYEPMTQTLLVPVICRLDEQERQALLEQKELLERFGFDVEELGGALAVRQAPFDVDIAQVESTLAEIAGKLLSGARVDPAAARDEVLHTMACKAAIKGGWHTSEKELERVARAVMAGEVKYCPHGRPVAIELTKKELEKQFKRA